MWRAGVLVVLLALLGGCAGFGKFRNYAGPEVTRIVVEKSERRMHLLHGEKVLRSYDIALGRGQVIASVLPQWPKLQPMFAFLPSTIISSSKNPQHPERT